MKSSLELQLNNAIFLSYSFLALMRVSCVYMLHKCSASIQLHLHAGMERVGGGMHKKFKSRAPGQSIGSCGQRSWKRPKHKARQIESRMGKKTLQTAPHYVAMRNGVRHNATDVQRRKRTRMSLNDFRLTPCGWPLPIPTRPLTNQSSSKYLSAPYLGWKHFAVDRARCLGKYRHNLRLVELLLALFGSGQTRIDQGFSLSMKNLNARRRNFTVQKDLYWASSAV